MTYRLNYSEGFTSNLDEHLKYLSDAGVSRFTIDRWFDRLYNFTESLAEWPERFPVDRTLTEATGRETRKANFGHYLISYRVGDDDRTVTLLGFVHGAIRRER